MHHTHYSLQITLVCTLIGAIYAKVCMRAVAIIDSELVLLLFVIICSYLINYITALYLIVGALS